MPNIANMSKISEHLKSFIPELVQEFKFASVIVSMDAPKYPIASQLMPLNSVNNHLFKPKFFKVDDTLVIHCPSSNIATQTLEAIEIYRQSLQISSLKYEISVKNLQSDYINFLARTRFNENVIIGQYYSIIDFFYGYIIKNQISEEKFEEFVVKTNLSRINKEKRSQSTIPQTDKIMKEILSDKEYRTVKNSVSIEHGVIEQYFLSGNVKISGKEITIIQCPWGEYLSNEASNYIAQIRKVKNVFVVGGCAGLEDAVEIEDILIPTSYISENIEETPLANNLDLSDFKSLSKSPNAYSCPFYTVESSLGTKGIRQSLTSSGIGAIEMELSYIAENLEKKNLFFCYYVMDTPNKGIGLSETYYNFDFLVELAHKPNRAKNICYEAVLNKILRM